MCLLKNIKETSQNQGEQTPKDRDLLPYKKFRCARCAKNQKSTEKDSTVRQHVANSVIQACNRNKNKNLLKEKELFLTTAHPYKEVTSSKG